MSVSTTMFDGRTLRIEREEVDVTSSAPRQDPAWRFTDLQGHEHFWRNGWPTLRWVVDETYWCEDCNDDHTEDEARRFIDAARNR